MRMWRKTLVTFYDIVIYNSKHTKMDTAGIMVFSKTKMMPGIKPAMIGMA